MAPSRADPEAITERLQLAVIELHDAGDFENLTVKRVRSVVEKALGLPDEYLKNDRDWKDRSKTIILEQVEKEQEAKSTQPSPQKIASRPRKDKASKDTAEKTSQTTKRRRAPTVKVRPSKKRRLSPPSASEAESDEPEETSHDIQDEESDSDATPRRKTKAKRTKITKPVVKVTGKSPVARRPKAKIPIVESEDDSDQPENYSINNNREGETKKATKANEGSAANTIRSGSEEPTISRPVEDDPGSGSETSVLIDDPLPAKKQRKSKASDSKKASKASSKTTSAKPGSTTASDPGADEIKSLQGWLVKCGIRKVWSKELAAYPSSKSKIKHLKDLLSEAGMTGRYSNQKAAEIKERRELLAEVEAAQDWDQRFGQDKDEDAGRGGRAKRSGAAMLADLGLPSEESSSDEEVATKRRGTKVVNDEDDDDDDD